MIVLSKYLGSVNYFAALSWWELLSKGYFHFRAHLQRDTRAPKHWMTHASSNKGMEVFRVLVITSSRMKSKKEKLWQASDLIHHTFPAQKILEIFQHTHNCDIFSSLNDCMICLGIPNTQNQRGQCLLTDTTYSLFPPFHPREQAQM